ncbi:hypothetical protein EYF80_053204 [Liparis tanakae]|uniref:Uncharacterized protein n=1 Tax=Liparis tanakae TaxID=230148 RepID=A0A4Z2F5V6_9TELE|nr:hypothetical protein EYF80_053204 [Liparis tanakae]
MGGQRGENQLEAMGGQRGENQLEVTGGQRGENQLEGTESQREGLNKSKLFLNIPLEDERSRYVTSSCQTCPFLPEVE